MRDSLISLTITEICKKLKIPFKSQNDNYLEQTKLSRQMACIYRDLRGIIGRLEEIERKHKIAGLSKLLQDDIKILEEIDHEMLSVSKSLKKKR